MGCMVKQWRIFAAMLGHDLASPDGMPERLTVYEPTTFGTRVGVGGESVPESAGRVNAAASWCYKRAAERFLSTNERTHTMVFV